MSGDYLPPRNAREAFEKMPVSRRETIRRIMEAWLWEFATATACAYDNNERVMPTMPRGLAEEMTAATLDLFVGRNP